MKKINVLLEYAYRMLCPGPLVEECIGHLECRLIDKKLTGKYCLFIAKITCARVNPGT